MATLTQTNYEIAEWLMQANGKYWNPDNAYGIQCVDLIDQYAEDLFGVPWEVCVGGVGGAMQLPNRAPSEYWQWFPNRPNDRNWAPIKGDVLVYGGTGGDSNKLQYWGHTAIALEKRLDAPYVLQQDGAAQHRPAHTATLVWSSPVYGTITGWLRPRPNKVRYTGADKRLTAGQYYVVKSGDTLGIIARRYNSTVVRIAALNGIKDANKISVGHKLRVK